VSETKAKMVTIKNNEHRIHSIAHYCQLFPGVNQVPAATWDQVKGLTMVQLMLEQGILSEEA
jgi:hypothetical protein